MKTLFQLFATAFILLFFSQTALAQNEKNWMLNGYVKDMQTLWLGEDDNQLTDNLIHNRLNFKYYASDKITFSLGGRNRLLWGEMLKFIPNYSDMLAQDAAYFNLSHNWISDSGMLLNSSIDRLNLEYSANKWSIRLGRQRINWGMNLVWNPNDIFNSYSYFDFDYEERSGIDALRFTYYTGASSQFEYVAKIGRTAQQTAMAALYKFNKWNYDFQFIAGKAADDYIFGYGWAGDIKGAGFRGEFSYFQPENKGKEQLVGSISADYSFKNGWYIHFSGLYNSLGLTKNAGIRNLLTTSDLSPKNLTTGRWNVFAQVSKPITPLFSVNASSILNPLDGSYYAGPGFTYSVADNLEAMLSAQIFSGSSTSEYGGIGQLFFLRLRYSF